MSTTPPPSPDPGVPGTWPPPAPGATPAAGPPPYADGSHGHGWPPPLGFAGPPPTPVRTPWVTRREVRAGLLVIAVLAVVGIVAGLGWLWWSPPRGVALALGPDTLLPDETEAFVAADGRFAVITGGLGFVVGFAAWAWRAVRGPVIGVALAVGCGVGATLTAAVGRLFGGGARGAATQRIVTPPLELRATGLLALQALVALLVYGLLVTVSARDDLGVEARRDDDPAEPVFAAARDDRGAAEPAPDGFVADGRDVDGVERPPRS